MMLNPLRPEAPDNRRDEKFKIHVGALTVRELQRFEQLLEAVVADEGLADDILAEGMDALDLLFHFFSKEENCDSFEQHQKEFPFPYQSTYQPKRPSLRREPITLMTSDVTLSPLTARLQLETEAPEVTGMKPQPQASNVIDLRFLR